MDVPQKSNQKACTGSNRMRIVMWIVLIIGGMIAGYVLDRVIFHRLYVFSVYHLVMLVPGWWLMNIVRKIARNTGRFLHDHGRRGDIPRLETNVLVTGGYYRYMRHPMHQGLLLAPLAIAFLAGSPSFVLIVAPLEMLLMYLLIVTVEEREALRKFGHAYREYMLTVPRFCCSCKCWKKLIRGLGSEEDPGLNIS